MRLLFYSSISDVIWELADSWPVFDGLNVGISRRPAYCRNRNDEKLHATPSREK